jgi:2,5-diamino-6-hydroxy-4-(5-phosphoribosylamino)pyrimidine 1'-reductase
MKPHVTLNFASSLDGVIGRKGERLVFSNSADKRRVHKLRANSDGIMVGVNTVLTDNPHLTVKYARGVNPARIVIDSRARTPLSSQVLDECARTIVAVSERAPASRRKKLAKKAEVVVSGKKRVDLKKLMETLHQMKINKILLEGGGTLNSSMLENNLVDEIYMTIAPSIIGEGIRWVERPLSGDIQLNYVGSKRLGSQVVLHYTVK